ncbi:MAG: hypothetical protein SV765_12515 [Pseudomonadota bacterium]|nr:hypothetical protein [Pseudomonadota bacterium]
MSANTKWVISCFLLIISTTTLASVGDLLNRFLKPPPQCPRHEMSEALDHYFVSLSHQDPTLLPVTDTIKFTENGKTLSLGDGRLWPVAGDALKRIDAIDVHKCAAVSLAVVLSNGRKSVLGVRILVENEKVSELETLYAAPGFFFSSPGTLLNLTQPEWNDALPVAQRSSPVVLRAYADSYFNALDTSGTKDYIPVPFADDCNRWENGIRTTFNNCHEQLKHTPFNVLQIGMTHRRFPVMDSEKGIAVGFASFTNIWNMMELFLIRDSKIQMVQAVLVPWTGQTGWE